MKLTGAKLAVTKILGRPGLVLQKHSPEILLGLGLAGAIGSTILACRATLKCDAIFEKMKTDREKIEEASRLVENGGLSEEEYTTSDKTKDTLILYKDAAIGFIKIYWPAVTLATTSIFCILGSHGIMKKRGVALAATVKALEEGFSAYRKRVVEEYGEETDYMFKNGLRAEQITETETDENGKEKKVKSTKITSDPNGLSVYARFFDESCANWCKTPEYNLMFLKTQQTYFNNMLLARGHVFLNEVYDSLGIERSQAGAVVGWCRGMGDDYIDFGIYNDKSCQARRFVNGDERTILLDFNVDGVIYDHI